jgi:tetratricopeptide (TPR) repeat protein
MDQNRENTTWSFDSSTGDYIEWQSENDFANEMTNAAFLHLYNFEYEKAMIFFEKSLEYDPSLFGPHVALAGFSIKNSVKQKLHIKKAKENVANKNETSKLFVSLLDLPISRFWPLGNKSGHEIWKKMREIEPKGKLIHYYYAFTLPSNEEIIEEMNVLLKEIVYGEGDSNSLAISGNHSYLEGPIYNILGYLNYSNGDKKASKEFFKKYIKAYPDGYNSYDSMGEWYLKENDFENSLKFYKKAREIYPMAQSANKNILKITEMKD